MAENVTGEILKEIRDAVRTTNDRIDQTRVGLGDRIDQLRVDLGGGIDQTNLRLGRVEDTLLDLAEQHRFVVRYMTGLGARDARIEGEVADLRVRVDSLEAKVDAKGP